MSAICGLEKFGSDHLFQKFTRKILKLLVNIQGLNDELFTVRHFPQLVLVNIYLRTRLTCENNALVSFFSGLGEFQTEALSICVEKQAFPVGNQMERYLSMDTIPNKIRGLFVLKNATVPFGGKLSLIFPYKWKALCQIIHTRSAPYSL